MLILDEPTSGVDPVARDEFWELLIDLSRRQGVTIFVSTHFMNEALRCDRISLMHAGNVLACDTPQALMKARGTDDLEQAFIGYIADAAGDDGTACRGRRKSRPSPGQQIEAPAPAPRRSVQSQPSSSFSLGRLLAYTNRETMEILRDPVRLAFAFVGSAIMMFVFGFGITTDVEDIKYAALDLDQTPESRGYLEAFAGSRYFLQRPPLYTPDQMKRRLEANDISLAIEIPTSVRPRTQAGRPAGGLGRGGRSQPVPRRDHQAIRRPGCTARSFATRRKPSAGATRGTTRPRSRRGTSTTRPSRASTRSCPASRRSSWS